MEQNTDIIIDFESLGYAPECAVINLASVPFVNDPNNPPTFKELCDRAFYVKFDIPSQRGIRVFDKPVIEWWKSQSVEAQEQLKPNGTEVSISEGLDRFYDFLDANNVKPRFSQMWARGDVFDVPLLINLLREKHRTRDTNMVEPVRFWNTRDVRTAIESTLLTRNMCECPLPNGALNGFVAHDAIHDCARDVLMLIYAKRYAMGLEDLPVDPDPNSVKKQRG